MKSGFWRFALQVLGVITLAFTASDVVSAQTTRTVCASGCDYVTIQAAVNASSAGDTVQVQAGTYSDSLITINKSLTLQGAQAGQDARLRGNKNNTPDPTIETILTSSAGPYMFQLLSSNITIDGFWFQDLGVYGGIENASANTDYLAIKNNVFFAKSSTNCTGVGNIQLAGGGPTANYFDFENNYATMNLTTEPSGGGCAYFLLMEAAMDHGTIRNNYFNTDNVAFGPFGQRVGWVIDGNEFDGSFPSPLGNYKSYGFNANLGDVTITNNNVHKMYVGLGQISVVGGTISGNTFNDNQFAAFQLWGGEYGTVTSGNVPIQDNVFAYNGVACTSYLDASHGVRLRATDYPSPPTDDPNGIDATTIHFRSNYFQDLHVGGCNQAWAIRNNAGPSAPPTTLADAAYNWWGQNSGPAATQTDGYETTDPYIALYTADPTKAGANGFWPLITTSTSINSASPEPSAVNQQYALSVAVGVGLGGSLTSLTAIPGQVTATNTSDSTDTCSTSSNAANNNSPNQFVFSCTLTGTSVGTKTFTAAFTNTGTVPVYNTSMSDSYSHLVQLPTPTVTFGTAPAATYLGGNFTVSATTNSDGTLSYSYVSGPCALVSGSTFSASGAGTCVVQASTPATANFQANSNTQNVTIAEATTSIGISNLPGSAVYGGNFTPAYTYTGDGTTSTVSNSTGICTVSSGVVNFVGAGTCSLTASATAGTNYSAVTGSAQTFAVAQATTSISISNPPGSAVYGGNFTPAYTYTGDGTTSTVSNSTGICTVSSGAVNFVGVGTCSLTASATAGTHYAAVTGSAQTFAVGQAAPTITISNIPPSGAYGGGFTAIFAYTGDGTMSLATNTPVICSVSGFNVSFIGVGQCTLVASATAGTNYAAVTGSPQTFSVGQALQATLIVNVKSPASYNTTQILNTTGGSGTGAVTYSVGASNACSVSGHTLLITSGTGTCAVTATKAADSNYQSTTSSQANVTVQKASTPISISNIPKNAVYGNVFTPSFSYSLDGTEVALSSTTGVCTVSGGGTVTFVAVGTCSLQAKLTGSLNINDVTGSVQSFSVIKATPTVIVSSTENPSYYGDNVGLITAILPSTATGSVSFYDGKTLLGMETLSGGQATLSVATLKVGSHSITVVYGGDSNNSTATSAAFTQTVSKANPSVALSPLTRTSAYGTSVTFTATASGVVSGTVPTGTMTFKNGGATLGNVPLTNGIATFSTSTLAVGGPYSITAVYGGDANYTTATSNPASQTVTKATPTMNLATSAASVKFGTMVTFTATLPATATGSATFYDGASSLGSVTLTKGVAKFSTKALTKGTHSITASYSGDFNFTTTTSGPVAQQVN